MASGIDHTPRLRLQLGLDSHNLTAGNGNILPLAAIRKVGIADDEIECHGELPSDRWEMLLS
ncbi:hypothetical protein [Rhizobium lusitanum]|uniref:hypothetical protein n=1 Tax=Rhizobium lusitanum TaxID=293958 RepID=UPI0025727A36|nr:hypothetical protein [Rhizobium lusitanum]